MGDYEIQILIQYLMLFAAVSIILLPAISFRDVAVRRNKKGGMFFFIGIGFGLASLGIGILLGRILMEFRIIEGSNGLISFLLLVALPTMLVTITVTLLRNSFEKR